MSPHKAHSPRHSGWMTGLEFIALPASAAESLNLFTLAADV